jgi:hypothetical protein
MWNKKLWTDNRQKFLETEYESAYKRAFASFQEFENKMDPYIRQCLRCNGYYWLGNSKPCDCEFDLNTNNHAKKAH